MGGKETILQKAIMGLFECVARMSDDMILKTVMVGVMEGKNKR